MSHNRRTTTGPMIGRDWRDVARNMYKVIVGGLPLFFALSANAEQYNFEATLVYESSETETMYAVFDPFGATDPVRVDVDTDSVAARGTWFFNGLTVTTGPRSQAAFLDRASSLSFGYLAGSTDTTSTGLAFPAVLSDDPDVDSFDAGLRYVWKDSGWFALARLAKSETRGLNRNIETTIAGLGVGKYLFSATSVQFEILQIESDVSALFSSSVDEIGVALTGKHIGDLGSRWQYGARLTLSNQSFEGADGIYDATFSLYPNRDLALNFSYLGQLGGTRVDADAYALDAAWFVTPKVQVSARYSWGSADGSGINGTDQSGFGLFAKYRF